MNDIPSTSTRRDISLIVSKTHKISQQLAYKIIDTTFEALLSNLIENGHVELRGFGVFKIVQRCARRGRNPKQPDQEVPIPPRKTIKFHASRLLRQDLVNAKVATTRARKEDAK
ncbi:MAG: HU family DNA-binding protein [bacterium]|nr:HU family DNA-binding protein [bacterium]MDO5462286.1 HU family DNA-binding protein [bacterium]